MRNLFNGTSVLGAAVAANLLLVSGAFAAAITGTVTPHVDYAADNISARSDSWTIYGGINTFGDAADRTYGGLGTGSAFSALTAINNGTVYGNYGTGSGRTKYTYTGGQGSYPGSATGANTQSPKSEGNSAAGLSLTHTLSSAEEKLTFVVSQEGAAAVDLNASLSSGATFSAPGVVFMSADPYGTPTGHIGVVALDVTGSPGDVLTFSIASSGGGNGVAVSSASVVAVPEPASIAGVSVLAITALRRRRAAV